MKLVILSDSHGHSGLVQKVLRREADAGAIFFLGDGLRDIRAWVEQNPGWRVYMARGNCDGGDPTPDEGLVAFEGVLFFYTHGHRYAVKHTLDILSQSAAERGASVALFGHTHCALDLVQDGVRLFNPGSIIPTMRASYASYGVIEVERGEIVRCSHKMLDL